MATKTKTAGATELKALATAAVKAGRVNLLGGVHLDGNLVRCERIAKALATAAWVRP
jgi:hypothetical protein